MSEHAVLRAKAAERRQRSSRRWRGSARRNAEAVELVGEGAARPTPMSMRPLVRWSARQISPADDGHQRGSTSTELVMRTCLVASATFTATSSELRDGGQIDKMVLWHPYARKAGAVRQERPALASHRTYFSRDNSLSTAGDKAIRSRKASRAPIGGTQTLHGVAAHARRKYQGSVRRF